MIYGYFDSPFSEVPAHDPGLEIDCPICYLPLSHPMKTISLLAEGDSLSYFYRVHKDCYEGLSPEQEAELDAALVDLVGRSKYVN